jgi:signal transduction histidine kinase
VATVSPIGSARGAGYGMSVRTGSPQTALEAVTWPRLLISSWPWRSAGYLLMTLPLALVAFAGLAIPWLLLAARLTVGGYQVAVIAGLILLGAVLMTALGPVIAMPLAELGRRRLRLVDVRPVSSGHRKTAAAGPLPWLWARYAEPAAWREVGYACLLVMVAPVAAAALATVPLAGIFITSPFLVLAQRPGGGPVALPFGQVATVGQALPYAIAGVLLLPVIPYLLTLLAGGHAALARTLLLAESSAQLRAELVEVSRSRARLADAFEAEHRRIERDLHDGAQQRLVSLTLQLGLARLDLPPGSPAAETITAAHEQAKQLMAELRELIHGIQPQILADLGVPAALGELADQCPLPVTVSASLDGRLPGQIENTAYFVAAEALTNVAKHSGATSATVTARQHRGVLIIEIRDNGHGGAEPDRGTGLTGLADRVAATSGRMLLSSPPGGPTCLRVELPCR